MAFNQKFSGGRGGFRSGGRDGGRSNFKKKSWGDRDAGDREMFKATCADCGATCEVPFRPTGEKPVFCSDCFAGKRDSGFERAPRREFNDRAPRPSFEGPRGGNDDLKKQIENLGFKIDKLTQAIEAMSKAKPAVAKEVVKDDFEPLVIPKVKKAVKKAVAKPATKKAVKKGKK